MTKLQNLRLLKNSNDLQREIGIFLAGLAIWLFFGGTKLFFGLLRNKPSGFLVVELILALVAYSYLAWPHQQTPTHLGRRFLQRLRQTLEPAQQKFKTKGQTLGVESSLLMATFGVLAFNGTPYMRPFENAYHANNYQNASGSNSGGCGSGGCGGGGCGGGGCGGGGCGGCGGSD